MTFSLPAEIFPPSQIFAPTFPPCRRLVPLPPPPFLRWYSLSALSVVNGNLLFIVDHLLHNLLLGELDHDRLLVTDNLSRVSRLTLVAHTSFDDSLNVPVNHLECPGLEEPEVVAWADLGLTGHVGTDASGPSGPSPTRLKSHLHARAGAGLSDVYLWEA